MRFALAFVFFTACGGPSRQQLAETPSAQAPARPAEAPPASTSDKDRERLIQQFDDMETTQRAHREAGQGQSPGSEPAPGSGSGSAAAKPPPNPKKAPVEQAPK